TAESFRQRRIVVTDRLRGKARVTVRRPMLLCNPTSQRFGKTNTKIRNATGRLVCYETQPTAVKPQTQLAWNEFGLFELHLRKADSVCLSSTKEVAPPPPP